MLKLPSRILSQIHTATINLPMEFLKLGDEAYQVDQDSFYTIVSHPSMKHHVYNYERHRISSLVIHSMCGNMYIKFSSGATLYNEDA